MASFDEYISAGVRDGILPGAILYAIDKSGKFNYSNILSPNSPSHIAQLKPSSTLWLASATKLITTIGILQLVERGVVTLDEDVSSHIPILASQQVLTGFPSPDRKAQPVFAPRANPITLRLLLTHAAGTTYNFLSPDIQRWQSLHKIPPLSGANWIDREAGVAGLFGTQIMPAAEPVTEQYIKAFEDEMYSRVEALTSESKLKTRL
ncbi:hypothetical protein VdG1_05370 [Verticillium dahliae VDG1]|nr:hypothetical protein VdG1_05370 [Verticillium dahliae VDG1]